MFWTFPVEQLFKRSSFINRLSVLNQLNLTYSKCTIEAFANLDQKQFENSNHIKQARLENSSKFDCYDSGNFVTD